MRKSAWVKRIHLFPKPLESVNIADCLRRYCAARSTAERALQYPGAKTALALHKHRTHDNFFAGQLTRYSPGKHAEVISLSEENQVEAEDLGPPPAGKNYVDSSLFFVVQGSLLAVAATRSVTAGDLQEFLSKLVCSTGSQHLPCDAVAFTDLPDISTNQKLSGVRNFAIETTLDGSALESAPELMTHSETDWEDDAPRRPERLKADVAWRGARGKIASLLSDLGLPGGPPSVDLSDLAGDQRLRVRIEVFAEGDDRNAEHAIANALAGVVRMVPDVTHSVDMGKFGMIKGKSLRIRDDVYVGEPYGAGALSTVANALADWLTLNIAAHELTLID